MDKFRVKTGDIDMGVKAINHRMAAMKAIEKSKTASLGVLIEVKKEGDDHEGNTMYINTEFVLGVMGLELLVSVYDKVCQKKGETDLKELVDIQISIERKYKEIEIKSNLKE